MILRWFASSNVLVLVWAALWLALVAALIIFWTRLPTFLAWSLAVVEVLLVPDYKTVRNAVRQALFYSKKP